jgi:hypothetical protein
MATDFLAREMTLNDAHPRAVAIEMNTTKARTTSAAESRSTNSHKQRMDICTKPRSTWYLSAIGRLAQDQ